MATSNNIKFLTCIYTNLHGTEFGGQDSNRIHRYKYSLLSLLKMTEADFVCYTGEEEINDLEEFFYNEHNISHNQLKFEVFNLRDVKFASLIDKVKNVEEMKQSVRCHEVQYSKFHWWWNEDKTYDYYYWIDAGISCINLLPTKFLNQNHTDGMRNYYDTNLFNNTFLDNLVKITRDKFLLLGKENIEQFWSQTVPEKWYKNYNNSLHIIGGLFGGSVNMWDKVVPMFEDYVSKIISEDRVLYFEELFMSLMYVNDSSKFKVIEFDTWHHEDSGIHDKAFFETKKSFYEIITDLNK
tara:strand:+ start:542 stop:1429 length:888 start_codon:yes stop_codon:yes gene_type:complete